MKSRQGIGGIMKRECDGAGGTHCGRWLDTSSIPLTILIPNGIAITIIIPMPTATLNRCNTRKYTRKHLDFD